MSLRKCPKCDLVQLGEQTNPELMYRDGYGYKSGVNEQMVAHLRQTVDYCAQWVRPGDKVLDIGCNDGTLLRRWGSYNVDRFGCDPIAEDVPGAKVTKGYWKADGTKYKVITALSMFYDLPDPVGFLMDIRDSLEDTGVCLLEMGYAGTLQDGKWDGICHEHLTYYGLTQLIHAANKAGLTLFKHWFNDVNGGSIVVLLCRGESNGISAEQAVTLAAEKRWDWENFGAEVGMSCKNIRNALGKRKVYALGASTKGNTILQLAGITSDMVMAAVDRQPEKVGKRLPGTNIPIISEWQARENPPDAFLVLPYHFKDQLLAREAELRKKGVKFIFPLPSVTEC